MTSDKPCDRCLPYVAPGAPVPRAEWPLWVLNLRGIPVAAWLCAGCWLRELPASCLPASRVDGPLMGRLAAEDDMRRMRERRADRERRWRDAMRRRRELDGRDEEQP